MSRRVTGWAFVLFVAVSLGWIVSGLVNNAASLVIQNALLLLVNLWGVWRFLLSPRRKRELELQQDLAERAHRLAEHESA